jgi:hypothetical protein
MKDAPANDASAECYVLEVDGIPQLEYRVFVEALSAGLQLRRDFPNCSVKLRTANKRPRNLSVDGALATMRPTRTAC